jgi:AraC family transcriptional regulator, positive regulator of tynA and feaB
MDDAYLAAPMRRWSAQSVGPSQRLDYWIGAICEGFLEMDATSPAAAAFDGELVSAPLGDIGLNRVHSSAQDVYRTPRAISRSRDNYFYLLCKTDSAWSTVQSGRAARLLPGDLALVDSRHCYELHFPVSANAVSLQLPTRWVEAWLARPEEHVARRIEGHAGWGAALGAFVRQMQPELAARPPLPSELLVDQLGALLALATQGAAPSDHGPAAATSLRSRIVEAIGQRHAEPGLTASEVASGLGISGRTLHRALSGSGTTFAQALADCRMAAAGRMLADRRFDRLSVAEIGRRVGYGDASHFVRLCRSRLGMTPGRLRRARSGS